MFIIILYNLNKVFVLLYIESECAISQYLYMASVTQLNTISLHVK